MFSFFKRIFTFIHRSLIINGIDIVKLLRALSGIPYFFKTFYYYKIKRSSNEPDINFSKLFVCLSDRYSQSNDIDKNYFFQDNWAAKRIYKLKPATHYDVGSRIDGFISNISVFTKKIIIIDVRSCDKLLSNVSYLIQDATFLNEIQNDSIKSISSLHAVEHFGLGRYNDPINPSGHYEFMKSLQRVLAKGGTLLFSCPIGKYSVYFNAHRILSINFILDSFSNLKLVNFSYIDKNGHFFENINLNNKSHSNLEGCGLFEFTKI